jgi:hypothetical protein
VDPADRAATNARPSATKANACPRPGASRPLARSWKNSYAEAARVCARIASAHDGADAVARFWELYWGELALVENREVEAEMVRFGQALQYMPEDRSELRHRALELAAACRASLA